MACFLLRLQSTRCVEPHPGAPFSQAALTAATKFLLQKHFLYEDGRPRKAQAVEDPHNPGLSLEYIFGSIGFTAKNARATIRVCIGEESLNLALKLICDLLPSTSQKWTLQGHLDTSLTHALTNSSDKALACQRVGTLLHAFSYSTDCSHSTDCSRRPFRCDSLHI